VTAGAVQRLIELVYGYGPLPVA